MIELITADLKTEESKILIHTSCMWLIAVRKSCWILFLTKPPNSSTCSGIGGDNILFVLMVKELGMFNTIPCMYIAALSGVARISEMGGGGGETNSPVSARAIIL